jgi:hypothetical protein
MCFSTKTPTVKASPPAPDPNKATLAAAAAQRADGVRQSSASNIIARLRDDDVAASAKKTRLGQ